MSNADLDERLREIVLALIEDAPNPLPFPSERLPAELEEIALEPRHVDELRGRKGRWRIVAAGAAAAAVLIVLVLTLSSGDTEDVIFTDDPEQPEQIDTEGLDASNPEDLQWSRVPHSQELFGRTLETHMYGVALGGPGLVAVGVGPGDGQPGVDDITAVVWTSIDGMTWSRVPHNKDIFGSIGGAGMNSVTSGGPGLIAVGSADGNAAVWTSIDGTTWSRVLGNDEALSGARMFSVTAGGPGLVAVGDAGPNAALWTSVDGTAWSRVPHNQETFGNGAVLFDVTAGGPGLVAVGWAGADAAAWTSIDGTTWTRVPHNQETFGAAEHQRMSAATAGGPGLVAVGLAGGNAAAWTSTDGTTWSRVPHTEEVFGGGADVAMNAVTTSGSGLIAVGSVSFVGDPKSSAAVWTSPDGITWSRVPDDGDLFRSASMTSVVAGGPGLVAVGDVLGVEQVTYIDAGIWTAAATDPE